MRRFVTIVILINIVHIVLAQSQLTSSDKRAIKFYNEAGEQIIYRQFNAALISLSKAIDRDASFTEAYLRRAGIYRTLANFQLAAESFQQAVDSRPGYKLNQGAYLYTADHYYYSGNYNKAKEMLEGFLSYPTFKPKEEARARSLLVNAEYAIEGIKNPVDFNPTPLPPKMNAFKLQYFPALTVDNNTIIFTRRLGTQPSHDEDIYYSTREPSGAWSEPLSISRNINTRMNEGTCTISADGKTLIFTSCQGSDGLGSCDLYISKKTRQDWSEPRNLGEPINSSSWESQPTLSADGRTLYFVSNRSGGIGMRDIWFSILDLDGNWGVPENAGDVINTSDDDISPFIHVNSQSLYFASEGHPGFGGLDLFLTEKAEGSWTKPKNLGYPLNDHQDQASLFITSDGSKGYYSHEKSDLFQGLIEGKIFEFDVPKNARVKNRSNFLTGLVLDSETKEHLSAQIELYDLNTRKLLSNVSSDPGDGSYYLVLTEGGNYGIYATSSGHLFKNMNFNYTGKDIDEPQVLDIYLDPVKKGYTAVLNNIFFDTDSYDLKEESITELDEVVKFLSQNAEIKMHISGHTDNVGTENYNKTLSLNRAKSVSNFLISNGVDEKRLESQGYGSTQPVTDNNSEETRSMNRRIEFKIL